MTAAQWTVEAQGLSKCFGDVVALDCVDLCAAPGSVVAVLGPNGAGKTTLLRILTTLLRPDGGIARVCGLDVTRQRRQVRAQIGVTGQSVALDAALTGRQNLRFIGRLRHLGRNDAYRRVDEMIERLRLSDAADRAVGTYSGGMRRRVDVAAGLLGSPPVVFLDEPTTGLDPISRLDAWDVITELVADGTTVMLTTQYLDEADRHADRIAVIDAGRVVANGTAEELKTAVSANRLDVALADPATIDIALGLVARHSTHAPTVDARSGHLSAITTGGAATVAAVARDLDAAGIAVAELALQRPSLDEVFLALTSTTSDRRR